MFSILALLTCLVQTSHGRFQVHRSLQGLKPLLNQKFDHHFHIDDEESNIQLDYSGTHHPDLLNLAVSDLVKKIHCTIDNTELTVTLVNNIDNIEHWLRRLGHPLTAVCDDGTFVYRRINFVKECGSQCIHFKCSKLELHHMFDSLKARFSFTPSDENTEQRRRSRRLLSRRSSSSSGVRGLATVTDVNAFLSGIKNVNEACTLKSRRLGFMKKTFTKWKSETKATFNDMSDDLKSEFQSSDPSGKNRLECAVGPNLEINYDSAKDGAKEEVLAFKPWASCHGCYLWAGIKVVVEIDVTNTGLNKFQAYVEGGFKVKAKLIASNPVETTAEEDYTVLIPPQQLGTISFAIGSVPVKINIQSGMEVTATSTASFDATLTVGASAQALIRAGVEYVNGEWKQIMINDLGYDYMLPEWQLPPGTDARVSAHMRPIIELVVWETVPVVIKTQVDVGATLSTNGNQLEAGKSTSPAFCSDSYRMWWSLHGIVGVDDIKTPAMTINGKSLPQVTLVGGFVSDPVLIQGETEFQSCGKLCSGCFSDYLANRGTLEATALPNAAKNEGGRDGGGTLSGVALAIIICASIIGFALLAFAVVVVVKTYQNRGSAPFRTLQVTTHKTTTTCTTKSRVPPRTAPHASSKGKRFFPTVAGGGNKGGARSTHA